MGNYVFLNICLYTEGTTDIRFLENIEYLSPRNALKFAEKGLTVIYGKNGTGKSGYTRILKKVCGKPHTRDLIGNIYKEEFYKLKYCSTVVYMVPRA